MAAEAALGSADARGYPASNGLPAFRQAAADWLGRFLDVDIPERAAQRIADSNRQSVQSVTPRVFCAVTAVITDVPNSPNR